MKKIVIIGGGFGGVALALNLEKKLKSVKDISITLINRQASFLFNNYLYEIATSPEELTTTLDLQKSINIPISVIVKEKAVKFIHGEVLSIDSEKKEIVLRNQKVEFDFLVLAMGSEVEYFNIQGAKEYGLPLKNFNDALRIKNSIEFAIEKQKFEIKKKNIRFVIAGGGYVGLEFAGELKGLLDFLCWKHEYPRDRVQVIILEATSSLMPGMSERSVSDAVLRLKDLDILVNLQSPIVKVEDGMVEIKTREKISFDCLIWTVGIKGKALPKGLNLEIDLKSRVVVDRFLQSKTNSGIFVLGDQALILNNQGRPVPSSAQDAIDQAKYLSYALPILMQNKLPKAYIPKEHGFIVSLGGKWAILNYPPFYFTGFLAFVIHQFAHIKYFAFLVGWWKAVKLVYFQNRLYSRND